MALFAYIFYHILFSNWWWNPDFKQSSLWAKPNPAMWLLDQCRKLAAYQFTDLLTIWRTIRLCLPSISAPMVSCWVLLSLASCSLRETCARNLKVCTGFVGRGLCPFNAQAPQGPKVQPFHCHAWVVAALTHSKSFKLPRWLASSCEAAAGKGTLQGWAVQPLVTEAQPHLQHSSALDVWCWDFCSQHTSVTRCFIVRAN